MSNPEKTPGRCNAQTRDGNYCANHPVDGRERCRMHGGNAHRGRDHPDFKHGLFSDYLSEEDREVIELLEEYGDAEKLDEIIDWRLARIRRALKVKHEDGDDGPDLDNEAMRDEIDAVRKLVKDRNKIAEGEDINMGWKEMLAGDES